MTVREGHGSGFSSANAQLIVDILPGKQTLVKWKTIAKPNAFDKSFASGRQENPRLKQYLRQNRKRAF